jgi:hypothetical protein
MVREQVESPRVQQSRELVEGLITPQTGLDLPQGRGVADGSRHEIGGGVGGQDVTRAGAERVARLGFPVAHHDDRDLRRALAERDDHIGARGVGEVEGRDHDVDPAAGQMRQRAEHVVGRLNGATFERPGVDPDGEHREVRVSSGVRRHRRSLSRRRHRSSPHAVGSVRRVSRSRP